VDASVTPAPVDGRSVDPCPVCDRHDLALERPPHITVTGVQPYTELYRMGDLPMPVGVRCRSCGAWWQTVDALRAGEPGSPDVVEPVEGIDEAIARAGAERPADSAGSSSTMLAAVAAMGVGGALAVAGVLEVAFVTVGIAALGWSALKRHRRV
jgi:hypothetical protein